MRCDMLRWWSRSSAGCGTDDADVVVQLAVAGSQVAQAMATADCRLGLKGLSRVQRILRRVRAEARKQAGHEPEASNDRPTRFIIDSLFLESSYRYLCLRGESHSTTRLEAFHFVAGVRAMPSVYVFGHVVPVTFELQTSTRVRVSGRSSITAFERLDRVGMPVVGHAHTHPGRGPQATHPSITDRRFQDDLERGGHIAVGAIFAAGTANEAFVRFFAGGKKPFEIEMHGANIEEIESHVYRLRLADGDVSSRNGTGVIEN